MAPQTQNQEEGMWTEGKGWECSHLVQASEMPQMW